MKITGLLLAGGESRRFGSPKAFATYYDKPFYQVVLNQLHPVVDEAMIVTKMNLLKQFNMQVTENIRVIKDEEAFEGMGPLAGIYSGINQSNGDYYLTVACDMPFVTDGLFSLLIEERLMHRDAMAIIPVSSGRRQPLCALYHSSCQPVIEELLISGKRRMNDLLQSIDVHFVEVENRERQFLNVNTREEFKLVQKEID
ncbi:molybdenum cofactor guanylyltransferase [Bacillus sp. es.036]|uniref:molybdenum cofactor guanylyltransferase n=1 Tax=Bacillus sp. es.036 TaxID=1761764 RepID=UPI000BF608BA|nr:molybdenum cofactor guanylyltransferase [Bacillus sp. es.036]PFG13903.1 molybdopterin-guanine dinucleotide biosynthesis protein A [Bacillus sp. es.036]